MKISNLELNEEVLRNLYLKKLTLGEIQGPLTGKASIDKPWLKFYSDTDLKVPFPNMSIYKYLVECNKNNLDAVALDYFGNKITYLRLFEEISKTASNFYNAGIKAGDVVTIASPFLPEVIYSIYALNKIGAVANIVDPRVPADKLKKYIMGTNSKYLIALDSCFPKVNEIKEECDLNLTIYISPNDSLLFGLRLMKSISDGIKQHNGEIKKYDKLIFDDSKSIKWKKFNTNNDILTLDVYTPNSPAAIVYTSGTSGEPKGAISSNESLNNITMGQKIVLKDTVVGDKFLLIMPPFIAYGLAVGMHGQLCKGQTLVLIPNFNIDNSKEMLGELLKKHKPQTIMGVPSFMVDLVDHSALKDIDCTFLKNAIVGGDSMVPASEELVNAFLEAKKSTARIHKGWGLTEAESGVTYTKDDIYNPIGSVGIPLPGNNIKIIKCMDEDATDIDVDALEELDYGEEGEIFVNSKAAIIDYLNNEEESKRVFFTSKSTGERWIRTKDLGRITNDGFLYISGRMKRIIVRPDGHNISPFAIENIINNHPDVANCAVVGHASEEHSHGSFAVAYIQLKKDALYRTKEILEELKKQTTDILPPRDNASYFDVIDELPLTDIGKVDYKKLELEEKSKVRVKKIK